MSAKIPKMDQQQNGDKQSGSSTKVCHINWQTNEPIDVDAYVERNKDPLAIETTENLNFLKQPESSGTKHPKAIKQLCKLFRLNSKLTLQELKKELQTKCALLNLNLNEDSSEANTCTSIHVSQMPLWFKFFHVRALIQLKSEFDIDSESYYIDMFKDDQNKHTGECLIRFMEDKDCLQVYKDLQGIKIDEAPLLVQLDLDHKIAIGREIVCPKFEEQLRKYNETREKYKQQLQQEQKEEKENGFYTDTVIKMEIQEENNPKTIENVDPVIKQESEEIAAEIQEENPNTIENVDNTPEIKQESEENAVEIEENNPDTIENVDNNPVIKQESEENAAENPEINQATIEFAKDVAIKTDMLQYSKDYEDYDNTTSVIAEPIDINTWEEMQGPLNESISQSIEESTEITDKTSQNESPFHISGAPRDEYYYYYNKCMIIHIKNIPTNITYNSIFIIKDLLKNKYGAEIKFQYTKVTDDEKETADILLQFESHDDAVTACTLLDGVKILGYKIQAIMGLGYSFDKNITAVQLDLFERKMKMIRAWDRENGHTPKKARVETSFAPDPSTVDYRIGFLPPEEMCNETFGLSREFMLKMGLTPPFSRRIIVSHLHSEVNEAKLLEVFSLAGDVKKVHRSTDVNGVHQARIEYDHPLEAVQAISMFHKHLLYNEEMKVRMDLSRKEKPLPLGLSSIGKGLGNNGEPLRGVRVEAELQKIHKIFFELGKMKKIPQSKYKKGKNKNSSAFENVYKKVDLSNINVSKYTKKGAAGYFQTQDYLTSHGIPPSEKNCKNLHKIMAALQKKTTSKPNQNLPVQTKTIQTNQNLPTFKPSNLPNPSSINTSTSMNILSTSLNIQNRNQSLNVAPIGLTPTNFVPKTDALDEAINRVMQFITPNTLPNLQPTIAQGLQIPGVMGNIGVPSAIPATLPLNPAYQLENSRLRLDPIHSKSSESDSKRRKDREEKRDRRSRSRDGRSGRSRERRSRDRRRGREEKDSWRSRSREDRDYGRSRDREDWVSRRSRSREEDYNRSRDRDGKFRYGRESEERDYRRSRDSIERVCRDIEGEFSRHGRSSEEKGSSKKAEMLVFTNLPLSVTSDSLMKKMREIGEVTVCEMTGTGRAFLRFVNSQDSDRCIRLFHRSKVDGQVIDVGYL